MVGGREVGGEEGGCRTASYFSPPSASTRYGPVGFLELRGRDVRPDTSAFSPGEMFQTRGETSPSFAAQVSK